MKNFSAGEADGVEPPDTPRRAKAAAKKPKKARMGQTSAFR